MAQLRHKSHLSSIQFCEVALSLSISQLFHIRLIISLLGNFVIDSQNTYDSF